MVECTGKELKHKGVIKLKRIVAAVLAIILLATLTVAYAESTSKAEGKFKPTFVKTIGKNQSASQWMLTDSNRALFAVLFTCDFMSEYQDNLDKAPYDFRDLLYGDMYVGRSKNTLILAYRHSGHNDCIIMLFDTEGSEQMAEYGVYDNGTKMDINSYIEAILTEVAISGYYKVEPIDLQKALNNIR